RHVAFLSSVRSARAVHALMELTVDPDIEKEVLPAFVREADTVALALIPVAFAPCGRGDDREAAGRRHRAERMLRMLRDRRRTADVRSAAERYGDAASAAVEALFAVDDTSFYPPFIDQP